MIFFIRHGQTDWNIAGKAQGKVDIELNQKGREQAKEAAEKLKDINIDLIISSPLKRAKETALIVAESLKCPVIYDEGISERGFGEFEGLHRKEFDVALLWDYKKNATYEKAESIRSFFERVYATLDNAIKDYPGKNVLIVSHGGVSIPVYCYFNGVPENVNLLSLALSNCEVAKYEK